MSLPDAEASCSFQESSMSMSFSWSQQTVTVCVQGENHVHWPFSPVRYLVSTENQCKSIWVLQHHHWVQPAVHRKVRLYYIYPALVYRDKRTCLVIHDTPQPPNSHLAHAEKSYITLSPGASMPVVFYSIFMFSNWAHVSCLYWRLHLSYFLHKI